MIAAASMDYNAEILREIGISRDIGVGARRGGDQIHRYLFESLDGNINTIS